MAAAIAAARAGVDTVLVESRQHVGGTVAHSLIHTLGGLFDPEGQLVNSGLPAELVDRLQAADSRVARRRIGRLWVLDVAPETYQQVTREWLREIPRLRVLTSTRVEHIHAGHQQIERVSITTGAGPQSIAVASLIDATGSAHIVGTVAPGLVDREERAAAGLVVRLKGVAPGALDFPKGVGVVRSIRAAVEERKLAPEFRHTWVDRGVEEDEVYLKLFLPQLESQSKCDTEQLAAQMVHFIRTLEDFADARIDRVGTPGIRDGGRIHGLQCLTTDDLRSEDSSSGGDSIACFGSWPIEYWHPEQGVQMQTLPTPVYPIPLETLKVQGWDNLWAVGKCLSADPLAQSSARVVGTCWAMGEAAGKAVAKLHIEEGTCEPR